MTDPSAISIEIEIKPFEAAYNHDTFYKSYMLLIMLNHINFIQLQYFSYD